MGDIFNTDFRDFIKALNKAKVEYMLVGGYSVILHGYSRTTGDMDIWVNQTSENYYRIIRAFQIFGMPVFDMTESKFLQKVDYDVFRFGRKPVSIELMTQVKGLTFPEAFAESKMFNDEDLEVRVIHFNDLIIAKKAAGRYRDLNDIENLERLKKP